MMPHENILKQTVDHINALCLMNVLIMHYRHDFHRKRKPFESVKYLLYLS